MQKQEKPRAAVQSMKASNQNKFKGMQNYEIGEHILCKHGPLMLADSQLASTPPR
jgi:hypothetical protein